GLRRTLRVKLPALVAVASSPAAPDAIARGGALETLDLGELGIYPSELRPRCSCLGTTAPVPTPAPILADRPDALIARLARGRLLEPGAGERRPLRCEVAGWRECAAATSRPAAALPALHEWAGGRRPTGGDARPRPGGTSSRPRRRGRADRRRGREGR